MLYSVDSGKYIEKLPHKKEFDKWMKNLSDYDYQKIIDALNDKIDKSDINTSSWIPGNNWTGTVYEPIFHACGDNIEASGLFFGLILFDLLMQRQDAVWGFGRYEKNGVPIRGTTYFILQNPPPR
ncbi:MAG: hypothetical protein PHP06_08920 [Clostridia bacterium]|jgi:hypothetical protein|nr:hypothetical protein [Clostridia bacterium]